MILCPLKALKSESIFKNFQTVFVIASLSKCNSAACIITKKFSSLYFGEKVLLILE